MTLFIYDFGSLCRQTWRLKLILNEVVKKVAHVPYPFSHTKTSARAHTQAHAQKGGKIMNSLSLSLSLNEFVSSLDSSRRLISLRKVPMLSIYVLSYSAMRIIQF